MNIFKSLDNILDTRSTILANKMNVRPKYAIEMLKRLTMISSDAFTYNPHYYTIMDEIRNAVYTKENNGTKCARCQTKTILEALIDMYNPKTKNYDKVCACCIITNNLYSCSCCNRVISFNENLQYSPDIFFKYNDEVMEKEHKRALENGETDSTSPTVYIYNELVKVFPNISFNDFLYDKGIKLSTLRNIDKSIDLDAAYNMSNGRISINTSKILGAILNRAIPYYHQFICEDCAKKLFPNFTQEKHDLVLRTPKFNIKVPYQYLNMTTEHSNSEECKEIFNKARNALINIIESKLEGSLDRIKNFNFLGFPKPLDVVYKKYADFYARAIYKDILNIDDANFYTEGIPDYHIIESAKNEYDSTITIFILLDNENKIDRSTIDKIARKKLNTEIVCPWTKDLNWYYYSAKNRIPSWDMYLLHSKAIPYCKCNVRTEVKDISVTEEDENYIINIIYEVIVFNQEVHNP